MGAYVPPSGQPLDQQGAAAFNIARVYNDALLQTVSHVDGTAAYYVRGTARLCRVVRAVDGLEIIDCGSVAEALAFIDGILAAILTDETHDTLTDESGRVLRMSAI